MFSNESYIMLLTCPCPNLSVTKKHTQDNHTIIHIILSPTSLETHTFADMLSSTSTKVLTRAVTKTY